MEDKDTKGLTGRSLGFNTIDIPGELESRTRRGVTVAAGTVYDYGWDNGNEESQGAFQEHINRTLKTRIESINNTIDEVVSPVISKIPTLETKIDNNIPYTILYENQYINIPCDAYGNYTGNEDSFGTKVRILHGNVLELLNADTTEAINHDIDSSIAQYVHAESSGDSEFGEIYINSINLDYISDILEVPFHVKGESGTTVSGKIIFNKVRQGKSAYEEWKDLHPEIENPTPDRFIAELKNTDIVHGPKFATDRTSANEPKTIYYIPNDSTTYDIIFVDEEDGTITKSTIAEGIPGDITNYAGIYDVSEDNKTGNTPKAYSNLSGAITDIVAKGVGKGGMTIKYLGTDGKYHQYRLINSSFSDKEEYWERVVSENDYSKVVTLNDIERRKEIDFSEFGIVNRYIHTNSKAYSGNNSIYIPVEAGKTYIVEPVAHTGNEINALAVSILTSNSVTNNTSNETLVTSFATGYNSPIVAHRQIRLTMPSDAAYMFVQVTKLGGTVDISPRVFMVEDKDTIIDTKIAILNGVGIPFEFKSYAGAVYPPLRKESPSSPQTRILLELPVDYVKAISLKEPDNYSYFCVIYDGILPTINFYGVSGNGFINTPIDIESEIVNVDGFTPKTLLVVIRKGDGTESLANVQDISEILNIVPKVSDLPTIQTRERTIKTFAVCPITLSPSTGRPTIFMASGIGWGHTPRYIRVIGGERYVIKTSNLRFIIFEYDDNQTLINVGSSWIETEEDYEFVPSLSTSFILLAFKSVNNILEIPNAVAIEGLWGGDDEVFAKRPSDGYDNFIFPVKTDTCKKQSISDVSNITEQYKLTTDAGVIHLPANYNEKGTPTPLIIYIHGEADRYKGAVNYPQDASSGFATNNPYAPEWDAAGYAQMDVDLVPDCYNYERTGNNDHLTAGTSDDAACIEAAYEWVINHYNIARDGVYLIGRSRGAQAVMQVLGHYNPDRLPVLCAISNAGANTLINYEVFRASSADEWTLFCDAHGLPSNGRPAYTSKARNNIGALISNSDIAAFLRDNIDVWWNKAVTALPLLVQYKEIAKEQDKDYPEERNDFALRLYDLIVRSHKLVTSDADYGKEYCDWLKKCIMRSPVPIRFDWCVGDLTQTDWSRESNNYAAAEVYAFLNDYIGCKAEYRVWPTADSSGTQKNPHWHELMNFLDGDYKLANGVVIHNPSMARLEWLLWCQAHDRRVSGCVNPIEVE